MGLRESRSALAAADGVIAVEIDSGTAWLGETALDNAGAVAVAPTRLLPGFDDFMLGYSEAERAIDPAHHSSVVPGNNGVFKPTVVDKGRVVALWERKLMAKSVRVTVTPLTTVDGASTINNPTLVNNPTRRRLENAAQEYAAYENRPLEVRWVSG